MPSQCKVQTTTGRRELKTRVCGYFQWLFEAGWGIQRSSPTQGTESMQGLGGKTNPDSRNCRDLPLGGSKKTGRNTRAWMEVEHLLHHARTWTYMSREWRGMGENPHMPPLIAVILPWYYFASDILSSPLGWLILQASGMSNDLFSTWSRQSRNTIQSYRAWQARFPLEKEET